MKTLLLINGWVGWKVAEWLAGQNDCEIVGAVLHPEDKRKRGEDILSVLPRNTPIFDGSRINDADQIAEFNNLNPEIAISVFFGYILKSEFINMFPKGVVNLHPSFLPYNRGSYPNVWSIIDGTPAGVTMHYIDEGIDTGDIFAQKEVPIALDDTGATLYKKLDQECVQLFQETWPDLVSGNIKRKPQVLEDGTEHKVSDVEEIDEINYSDKYVAQDLIDILRARTFPHYPGAYIRDENGDKIFMRIQFSREEEIGGENDPPLKY